MNTVDNMTMKKMIRDARDKLSEITNIETRVNLGVKLDLAEKKENINEIKSIYGEISFICMQNHFTELPKSILYKEPPTFDQAVIDFLNLNIPDLIRLPEQDEFFGSVLAPEIESNNTPFARSGNNGNSSRGPNIEYLIETEIPKRKMLQTIGSTQTQKTNYQIGLALKSLLKGITPVMITRDFIGDASQLEKRINDLLRKLEIYLQEAKVINRRFKIKVVRADKVTSFDPFSIIISLGNESQIPKVIAMIKDSTHSTFVPRINVIIDENDKVDYSLGTKTYTALAELKEMAHQTFGITATPLDVLALQEDLKSRDVFVLTNPKDYRGHLDIMVKLLETDPKVKGINKVATYEEVIEHDKNFDPFLHGYSRIKPEYVWGIREHLPNICLIKVTNINATQEAIFEGIHSQYEKEFVMLLMHEKGIKMQFKGMKDCVIAEKEVRPDVFVKDIDLPEWFQYLKDNGGVKRFPRILVISGYKAERCISFVSRDYVWHLTDMYYNPASKTSIPTMWQETGRLTGRNKGKSHLHLHCTKRVADSLYNGINFTNEAITRGIDNPLFLEGEERTLFESILQTPMLNKQFPKYRNIVTKAPVKRKHFKLVRKNDGGRSLEDYKYTTDEIEEIEFEDNKEIEEDTINSNYYLIDIKKLSPDTSQYLLVQETIKEIKKRDIISENILRTVVIDWILENNISKLNNSQIIKGHFDSGITPKMAKIKNIHTKGLLYWKEDNRVYLRLNL